MDTNYLPTYTTITCVYPSVTRAIQPAIPPSLVDAITVKYWLAQLLVDLIVGIAEPPGQTVLGVHSWSVGLQPVG